MLRKLLLGLSILTLGHTALSQNSPLELEVSFREGAPKDRFTIKNVGSCDLQQIDLMIDLRETAGQLIFDTTAAGAGVEVFQPFEVSEGDISLSTSDVVEDGEQVLSLTIKNLNAGGQARFTIDLDDQLAESELGMIRVTGGEMQGARVRLVSPQDITATFTTSNVATLSASTCN